MGFRKFSRRDFKMGVRGTRKKPTNLKLLEGNPGKRPIDINEVKPMPIADPCPDWLSEYAKQTWHDYAPRLEKLGLLTDIDMLDFQNLCIQAGMLRQAYENLKKYSTLTMTTQTGYEQQRAEVGIVTSCTKSIVTLAARFGMSPSDRVGLVDPKAGEKKTKLSGLLSG
jgi:P27 family predicted phage terminase small subunit